MFSMEKVTILISCSLYFSLLFVFVSPSHHTVWELNLHTIWHDVRNALVQMR